MVDEIRILIADDHVLVREGTRKILEHEHDLKIAAEAGDGEEAVRLTAELAPDVAIIDINMPKLDGIEVTKQVKALCPQTKVLILSAYDEYQFILRLLECGADGYLLKSVRGNELVEAVRSIYMGGVVFHPSIARQVLNHFVPNSGGVRRRERSGVLSKRELDIVKLIARGLSNREIATGLGLSIRTVQGHIGQVFKKLGASSRTEAMVRVLKEGWVTLDDVTREISTTG